MANNTITLADIPLPSSDGIERQVIYDAVNNPDAIGDMAEIVSPSMFTDEFRRDVWEAIIGLYNKGDTIDFTTLFAKTGQKFISEIVQKNLSISSQTASMQHAEILRSNDIKRKAYFGALRLLQSSTDAKTSDEALLADMEKLSHDIQTADYHEEAEVPLKDILNTISDEVQERYELARQGKASRIPTGLPTLDGFTYGGWGPGQLIILAARPSMGKTSVMLKFARAAAEAGFPACIFSVEMTNSELGQKALYSTEFVKPQDVSSGQMDWGDFERAMGRLQNLPIYVNDHTKDVNTIISRINVNARKGRCKIAFIDYLGLMDSGKDSKTPLYQALGYITTSLKVAAKRAKIPIVLLCQLNRDAAKENRPPQLTDLRDSGSIEQDADIVMMLSQKTSINVGNPEAAPEIDIWLRKNRQYKKDVRITIKPNDTFSEFYEVADSGRFSEPPTPFYGPMYDNNNNDYPFER